MPLNKKIWVSSWSHLIVDEYWFKNYWYPIFRRNYLATYTIIWSKYGIPCPACGTTRGIILITEGRIIDGVLSNPNSIIIFPIIFMYPIIRLYDCFTHKTCSQKIYLTAEAKMGKKILYIPFVITEVIIWALNIYSKK